MTKRKARRLRDKDRVEIRFAREDSFTPSVWECGKVMGEPVEEDGVIKVSVLLDCGLFVAAVPNKRVR